MKAYISISYHKRSELNDEVNAIKDTLQSLNIMPFVFVDMYKFTAAQSKPMMQQALADIDTSHILIAETSDKGIGIGIEVGYAKAKGKPVIYLRHQSAEHSTTVSGVSDFQIIYENTHDLMHQLVTVLERLIPSL